jgi:hypothetical protein
MSSMQQEENSLHQQNGHKFKEETSTMLNLERSLVWRWNWDSSESRPEIPGKF